MCVANRKPLSELRRRARLCTLTHVCMCTSAGTSACRSACNSWLQGCGAVGSDWNGFTRVMMRADTTNNIDSSVFWKAYS